MTAGSAIVLRGDARTLPLPDNSVDLIVTSPPYFALRSYTDGGEHYTAQIGSESTPQEYIASLMDCTREWVRALKPSGSMWINLGDKYSDRGHGPSRGRGTGRGPQATHLPQTRGPMEKSLLLLPERYRIACTDKLGLIARAVVIWSKPNGLPESVTDRVRRSHEDWVHLTKLPRYFSAVDEIRTSHARTWTPGRNGGTRPATVSASSQYDGLAGSGPNALGALPSSVWEIPTEPLTVPERLGVDHFAAFPTEWPRRIILGWSPSGICTACGEGRRPVVRAQRMMDGRTRDDLSAWASPAEPRRTPNGAGHWRFSTDRRLVGETCACSEPNAATRPSVVLDPFGGTGTAALVAAALGRIGISVDRSADYCRLAQWRTTDPAQIAKVLGRPKPRIEADGQGTLDLFSAVGGAA